MWRDRLEWAALFSRCSPSAFAVGMPRKKTSIGAHANAFHKLDPTVVALWAQVLSPEGRSSFRSTPPANAEGRSRRGPHRCSGSNGIPRRVQLDIPTSVQARRAFAGGMLVGCRRRPASSSLS